MEFSSVWLTVAASWMTTTPGWTHDLKNDCQTRYGGSRRNSYAVSWGHKLPQDSPIEADAIDHYESSSALIMADLAFSFALSPKKITLKTAL